ncbi:MAG: hypothetical protein IPJ41_04300 [Phycisphaerales bacterium]|nr:hypothetical protein [Phycisphaerales bacterium]
MARALERIGTRLTDAAPLARIGTLIPHPRVAASMRRGADAATNELFTDIETAPDGGPMVCVPRLRLCLGA